MGKESIHYIPVHSRDILIPNNLNTSYRSGRISSNKIYQNTN